MECKVITKMIRIWVYYKHLQRCIILKMVKTSANGQMERITHIQKSNIFRLKVCRSLSETFIKASKLFSLYIKTWKIC